MFLVLKFVYSKKKKRKKKHNTVNIYSCSLDSYKGYETKLAKSHDATCYIHKLKKISVQVNDRPGPHINHNILDYTTLLLQKLLAGTVHIFSGAFFHLSFNQFQEKLIYSKKITIFLKNQHIHGIK